MSKRGLGWLAVTVCVLLVVLGAHLTWEGHRNRLHTPKGTIQAGMRRDEVISNLGGSAVTLLGNGNATPDPGQLWLFDNGHLVVRYNDEGRVRWATLYNWDHRITGHIPRPSLYRRICSWLTGEAE
jgi:hypothetical protein